VLKTELLGWPAPRGCPEAYKEPNCGVFGIEGQPKLVAASGAARGDCRGGVCGTQENEGSRERRNVLEASGSIHDVTRDKVARADASRLDVHAAETQVIHFASRLLRLPARAAADVVAPLQKEKRFHLHTKSEVSTKRRGKHFCTLLEASTTYWPSRMPLDATSMLPKRRPFLSRPGLYIANFEYRDSRLICNIFGGQSPPLSPFL
jgi:hypothetical protein